MFLGFTPDSLLPVKRGDTVTIKKGVKIRHRGEIKTAGRTYKVVIHHILNGITHADGDREYARRHGRTATDQNPTVCFAGTGGYWSEVDINDIPEALQPSETTQSGA
jgi:hypothetical protein